MEQMSCPFEKNFNRYDPDNWSKQYETWYKGAGVIIKNAEGRILLVQDLETGKWSFPKGAPEAYDYNDPLNTAIRECQEEVGLKESVHYKIDEPYAHRFAYDRYYFKATFIEGNELAIRTQASEVSAAEWLSIDEMKSITYCLNSGVREYLRTMVPRKPVSNLHKPRYTQAMKA